MTSRQTWNAALELSKRAEKQADPTGEECANLPPSGRLDTGAVSLPDMFSWMITRDDRPLLYLNVDGPLIPFRARPLDHGPTLRTATAPAEASGNPLVDRLDPTDGRRLLALGCQLVWATTWMADANEVVAPRLGLAELPIVDFPDEESPERGLRWKTKPLAQDAGNRPSIWLTTRSPTLTSDGSVLIIRDRLYCTASTHSSVSPTPTSPRSAGGLQLNSRDPRVNSHSRRERALGLVSTRTGLSANTRCSRSW